MQKLRVFRAPQHEHTNTSSISCLVVVLDSSENSKLDLGSINE